jgi:hypothetical protein
MDFRKENSGFDIFCLIHITSYSILWNRMDCLSDFPHENNSTFSVVNTLAMIVLCVLTSFYLLKKIYVKNERNSKTTF